MTAFVGYGGTLFALTAVLLVLTAGLAAALLVVIRRGGATGPTAPPHRTIGGRPTLPR
ncbi:MAG TPA: hypothetical protein VFO77_16260 [Actinoplanes sp.]|nr:hypothetical protein [Actinoplanes sp.]